jgi:hypothetical protein
MARQKLLPPPTPDLGAAKLEVKFVSQIARAQESVEGENFLRALQASGGVAQFSPEALDYVNGDEAVKFLFRVYGGPLNTLRKDQDVGKMRKDRAQKQQAAMEAELNKANSEATKNTAQAQAIAPQE